MMYHKILLYTMEQIDEVVEFDAAKHSTITFENIFAGGENHRDDLTWFDRLVGLFFYQYASEVWNKTEHHPDHDVAIIVTVEQLASVFDEKVEVVEESIKKLLDCQIIGIVPLPDGRFAYHFVL